MSDNFQTDTKTHLKILQLDISQLSKFTSMNIRRDLIVRVSVITAIFSILSYFIIQSNSDVKDIPVFFVLFGVVTLISIVFDIDRFHVVTPEPNTETKA
jgi:hypothetical protein